MLFPKINFNKIEIYSTNKKIFEFKFSKINFIVSGNNSWKTTFFHIIKDLLWIDNVVGSNVNWKKIFTTDLFVVWLRVKLTWNVNNDNFIIEKEYIWNNYKIELFWKEYWNIDDFWNTILLNYNINFPNLSDLKIKSTISVNSLLRLNFFSDDIFRNKKIEKNEFLCDIINHNQDSIFKILFYSYVFDIFDNFKLKTLYSEINEFRKLKNDFDKLQRYNKTLWKIISEDTNNLFNFDLDRIQDDYINKEVKKKNIKLENLKYKNALDKINILFNEYNLINSYENNDLKYFIDFLESEKNLIENELDYLNNQLNNLNNQLDIDSENYKYLVKQHLWLYNKHLIEWEWNIDTELLNKIEKLKVEKDYYEVIYNKIINQFNNNEKVSNFLILYKSLIKSVFNDKLVETDIYFDIWKYSINTTSDSYRRISQLVILCSFLLQDLKMFNFMFFDSPIIWIDKNKTEDNINFHIWEFFKELLKNNINWQIFITTNDSSFDLDELFRIIERDKSLVDNDDKYYDNDISILINKNNKLFNI